MKFLYLSIALVCLSSVIASPFPVDVNVDVGSGSVRSPHVSTATCNDAEDRVRALGLDVDAVICLSENDSIPSNAMHTSPSANERCPLVDVKVRTLGLDIRAVVCLKDRIDVFVDIH